MGSDETATATTGGPRVIDVFYGNGAPSGPNYLLFSGAARLSDALRDRSGVGWSPRPHAPALGAPQRALDPKLGGVWLWPDVWLRELPYLSTAGSSRACGVGDCPRLVPTKKRLPGDLRTTNRLDSAGAPVMVGPSTSRIKKINFFGPR